MARQNGSGSRSSPRRPSPSAASTRTGCRCWLPGRRFPECRFPADSWLPGHKPTQDARCAASGGYAWTSAPISEMTAAAASGAQARDGDQEVPRGTKGLHRLLDLRVELRDHSVGAVQVGGTTSRGAPEPALQRHRQVRDLAPHPARARSARTARTALHRSGLNHRPPGLRRDGRGDRVDPDPGVLQRRFPKPPSAVSSSFCFVSALDRYSSLPVRAPCSGKSRRVVAAAASVTIWATDVSP